MLQKDKDKRIRNMIIRGIIFCIGFLIITYIAEFFNQAEVLAYADTWDIAYRALIRRGSTLVYVLIGIILSWVIRGYDMESYGFDFSEIETEDQVVRYMSVLENRRQEIIVGKTKTEKEKEQRLVEVEEGMKKFDKLIDNVKSEGNYERKKMFKFFEDKTSRLERKIKGKDGKDNKISS